jgi:hypothetical protein
MRSISCFGNETLRGVYPEVRRIQGDNQVETFAQVYRGKAAFLDAVLK